jgi:pyruvate kinase
LRIVRRTRILATLGPATDDRSTIDALIAAGVDAFRLNFSHGTHDDHAVRCRMLRAAAAAAAREIAILQDLAGPKLRIGTLSAPLPLAVGDTVIIERGRAVGSDGRVSCDCDPLFTSVGRGDRLLVDDGRIELEVNEAGPDELVVRVIAGGTLESNKGINVPGVTMRTLAFTAKDREDLAAGIAMGIDVVAVSFVQAPDDIGAVRQAAATFGRPHLPIVAKIERPQAVERIEEILDVCDGLMVARGDLGVELPLETIPAVQRGIILAARRRGTPVILATQVLESMRTEPRPTRAEVTDAAYAVEQRVDTIMLAGETAAGLHPLKAVEVLDAIIQAAEGAATLAEGAVPEGAAFSLHARALSDAAVALADRAAAEAIVAISREGATARLLAAMRPVHPIYVVTPSLEVVRQMSLVWGVTPVLLDKRRPSSIRAALVARGLAKSGTLIVMVSAHADVEHEGINFVHIERV